MKILGIDTSCDDTSIAVLEKRGDKLKIISNIISSQVKIHRRYGGVYPSLAKREHQRNLVPVVKKALLKQKLLSRRKIKKEFSLKELDFLNKVFLKEKILRRNTKKFLEKYNNLRVNFVAVTIGPGLEPCLWAGINFAKALSFFGKVKVIPANHIEAHIFGAFLNKEIHFSKMKNFFPAISLVVSGGHTQLILVKKIRKYFILGETRDDAAGECLDKVARVLGLGYPGGPEIEKKAKETKGEHFHITLPRPLFFSSDYDFSFSGLKTAVIYEVKKNFPKERFQRDEYIKEMAKEVQSAIIDVLLKKALRAAKEYKVKTIILGGGVTANGELRRRFRQAIEKERFYKFNLLIPQKEFSTDNGAQVALAGLLNIRKATFGLDKLVADGNLRI